MPAGITMGKNARMKVFISWSGTRSRVVAETLHWWFPKVLQGIQPFVSAKDIDKGANWTAELSRELEDAEFGIICLTPENLTSPWLHYEAGAMTKSVESRVCPLLYDLEKAGVGAPLNQLQLTDLADQQDMILLMTAMNTVAGNRLTPEDLRESLEMWWPRLSRRLEAVPDRSDATAVPAIAEPAQPQSSDRELLLEVLDVVRELGQRAPLLARPVSGDEARAVRRELRQVLEDAGLMVLRVSTGPHRWSFALGELPVTVPAEVHTALSLAALTNQVDIRLLAMEGDDRVVTFHANGWASEPPF